MFFFMVGDTAERWRSEESGAKRDSLIGQWVATTLQVAS